MAFDLEAFLEDPTTTELFDRTLEQRARLVSVQNEVRKEGVSGSRLQVETNRRLLSDFGQAITDLARARAASNALAYPKVIQAVFRNADTNAEIKAIQDELSQLNEAMQIPGLDRLIINEAEVS